MSRIYLGPLLGSFMSLISMGAIAATPESSSGDSCIYILSDKLEKELDARSWSFHGLRALTPEQLDPKLSTYSGRTMELTQEQRAEVDALALLPGHEFYLLTGTSNYTVFFMDILVVESQGCSVVHRATVYFE